MKKAGIECMISKELFTEIIELIQKQDKIHDKVESALQEVTDGYSIFTGSELYYQALIKLLAEVMGDDCGMIEWWLYEISPEDAWVEVGETRYDLKTSGDLYNFLVSEMNRKTVLLEKEK